MPHSVLAAKDGVEKGLENLAVSLKQKRSRQSTEPMSTYLVRRQAWYQVLADLDKELALPEVILAEQTLMNAGVRSALGGQITMEGVHAELIAQHSRLHEREHRGHGIGYEKNRAPWRPHQRRKGRWTRTWLLLGGVPHRRLCERPVRRLPHLPVRGQVLGGHWSGLELRDLLSVRIPFALGGIFGESSLAQS